MSNDRSDPIRWFAYIAVGVVILSALVGLIGSVAWVCHLIATRW